MAAVPKARRNRTIHVVSRRIVQGERGAPHGLSVVGVEIHLRGSIIPAVIAVLSGDPENTGRGITGMAIRGV